MITAPSNLITIKPYSLENKERYNIVLVKRSTFNSILVRKRTNFFSKNELFFKDPKDVKSRSTRPPARYNY